MRRECTYCQVCLVRTSLNMPAAQPSYSRQVEANSSPTRFCKASRGCGRHNIRSIPTSSLKLERTPLLTQGETIETKEFHSHIAHISRNIPSCALTVMASICWLSLYASTPIAAWSISGVWLIAYSVSSLHRLSPRSASMLPIISGVSIPRMSPGN